MFYICLIDVKSLPEDRRKIETYSSFNGL